MKKRAMAEFRLRSHPILEIPRRNRFTFTFNGQKIVAMEGEVISSALFANGVRIFGHHRKDNAPQGIFCANGQCSQCMVIADGVPVKACMAPARPGMIVKSCDGVPALPADDSPVQCQSPRRVTVDVLVIGGGPAGLCAAIELGRLGIRTLLVDDKDRLGGKLTLQTHAFFGSVDDCYAGTRGIRIAQILSEEIASLQTVEVWLNSIALGAFVDGNIGVQKEDTYILVRPSAVLVATGAREKMLAFPGCDLPGVYGAGAFQTLANRDLVRPTERLFIVGGGNVGLIGGYHAIQAGIKVVGLVEVLPECGGYKVHLDKLKRLGVPVFTSHTVTRAIGKDQVEAVEIAKVDERFVPISGTERRFEVDTILIAVGLSPLDQLIKLAREAGLTVLSAGDADQIAEASAAMFSGRVAGRKLAKMLKRPTFLPKVWRPLMEELRSKPGQTIQARPVALPLRVYPVIRCYQEIPCNPCTQVCPRHSITLQGPSITSLPAFEGECTGCGRCVSVCPGLAISLVIEDYDPEKRLALVVLPSELDSTLLLPGSSVTTTDSEGNPLGRAKIVAVKRSPLLDHRDLLMLQVPYDQRLEVAGFQVQQPEDPRPAKKGTEDGEVIICRCERVTKREIVELIRAGVRDMNQIKARLRAGMGACGGKTCTELIMRLFRQEGVPAEEITPPKERPFVSEVPLSVISGTTSVEK